jgi:hypothetical protein
MGELLQRKSLVPLTRNYGLFRFHPFQKQAFDGLSTKKPWCSAQRLFLVAECDEISNLDLIKDVDKIVKLLEVLNI